MCWCGSVGTQFSIPPGNPPLWSLSVELLLSATILLLGRNFAIKDRLKTYLIVFLLTLVAPKYNLLAYFFYFYPGFFLSAYGTCLSKFKKC